MIQQFKDDIIWFDIDNYQNEQLQLELVDQYNNKQYTIPVSIAAVSSNLLGVSLLLNIPSGVYNYQLKTCQKVVRLFKSNCSQLAANCGQIYSGGRILSSGVITFGNKYKPYNIYKR